MCNHLHQTTALAKIESLAQNYCNMDTHILKELHFVSDHHFWYLGLLSQGAKRYTNHGKCRNNLAILAAHRSRVIGAHPTIFHMLRVGSPYNPLTTCAAKIKQKKEKPT